MSLLSGAGLLLPSLSLLALALAAACGSAEDVGTGAFDGSAETVDAAPGPGDSASRDHSADAMTDGGGHDAMTDGDGGHDALADASGGRSDAGGHDAGTSSDGSSSSHDASFATDGGVDASQGDAGGVLSPITIWIAGDSTVMTYPEPNTDGDMMVSLYGWGQEIGQFFSSTVTINNQAIGGRSVAFFMWSVVEDSSGNPECVDDAGTPEFQMSGGSKVNTSQWTNILNGMKAGDFLLIQFGTNDETHTCPRFVSLPDFETDFGLMADAARAKGATPIFVTPMGHRTFSGTTATNTLLPYANAMKDEASQKSVEVEDLNLESEAYYTSVGTAYLAANIFDTGTTHFTQAGAVEMATLIVTEVRKNNGLLAAYLQ